MEQAILNRTYTFFPDLTIPRTCADQCHTPHPKPQLLPYTPHPTPQTPVIAQCPMPSAGGVLE
ncbi:MAG: hypothetical protein F6J93_06965 [Oscillatoria sp. SIO1A7]|nr:hypothetical protein [Oscillatoria sp. SIO1A7]